MHLLELLYRAILCLHSSSNNINFLHFRTNETGLIPVTVSILSCLQGFRSSSNQRSTEPHR